MPLTRSVSGRLSALLALTLSMLALLVGPAAAAGPPAHLSSRQERIVLRLVDDRCGDTWCEGDYAFDFRRFSCDATQRACSLTLRIARLGDGPLRYRWRTRQVHGFVRFRQMVATAPGGYRSLDQDFTAALDEVIRDVEASVP